MKGRHFLRYLDLFLDSCLIVWPILPRMAPCGVRERMHTMLDINSLIGPEKVSFLCNYKRGEVEFCLSF